MDLGKVHSLIPCAMLLVPSTLRLVPCALRLLLLIPSLSRRCRTGSTSNRSRAARRSPRSGTRHQRAGPSRCRFCIRGRTPARSPEAPRTASRRSGRSPRSRNRHTGASRPAGPRPSRSRPGPPNGCALKRSPMPSPGNPSALRVDKPEVVPTTFNTGGRVEGGEGEEWIRVPSFVLFPPCTLAPVRPSTLRPGVLHSIRDQTRTRRECLSSALRAGR